jgi:hypothetical protein
VITAEETIATGEELDALAISARAFIEQAIDGSSDSVTPQLLVLLKDPITGRNSVDILVMNIPFNTHTEKHSALYTQGLRYYREQKVPIALTLISEAWISTEETDKPRKYLAPEDDPERVEAVIYHAITMKNLSRHGYRPVKRDAQQMIHPIGEWEIAPDNSSSAPLLGSFFRGYFAKVMNRAAAGAAR